MIKNIKKFLKNKYGEGSVSTAIKVVTAVVLGGLMIVGSIAVINDVVLPETTNKITSLFNYESTFFGQNTSGEEEPNIQLEGEKAMTPGFYEAGHAGEVDHLIMSWNDVKSTYSTAFKENGLLSSYTYEVIEGGLIVQYSKSVVAGFDGDVVLGNDIKCIDWNAFANSSISGIVIPDSVEELRPGCFYKCTSLKNISIGSGLKSVYFSQLFDGCSSLETITVSKNNPYFTSGNSYNGLFKKEKEGIYLKVACKNTVIPENTTAVFIDAFRTYSPSSITLPSSVKKIIRGNGSKKIKDINFNGSKEEWNNIKLYSINLVDEPDVDECEDSDILFGVTVHCLDGNVDM